MSEPEYDEKTCVTAGELRARGVPVPEDIPDVAWVPRASLVVKTGEAKMGDEPGKIVLSLAVEFTAPFRWLELSCTIEDGSAA